MGFGKKIKGSKWIKRGLLAATGQPAFLDRKLVKKLRSKVGLTAKNRQVRSIRRNLLGKNVLASSQPVSASTYQYQPRSIASLMGGR